MLSDGDPSESYCSLCRAFIKSCIVYTVLQPSFCKYSLQFVWNSLIWIWLLRSWFLSIKRVSLGRKTAEGCVLHRLKILSKFVKLRGLFKGFHVNCCMVSIILMLFPVWISFHLMFGFPFYYIYIIYHQEVTLVGVFGELLCCSYYFKKSWLHKI